MSTDEQEYQRRLKDERAAVKERGEVRRLAVFVAPAAAAVAGLVLAIVLGLVGAVIGVLGGAALGLAGAYAYVQWRTRQRVERAWLADWATARGWSFVDEGALPESTELLRRGDRRSTGWSFSGRTPLGAGFTCANYTYTVRRETTDSDGNRKVDEDDHHFLVLLLDAELPSVERLALSPRGLLGTRLFDGLESTFSGSRSLDLESAELGEACKLMMDDDADELVVRRIFEPAFQLRLLDPTQPPFLRRFEYERGTLVLIDGDHVERESLHRIDAAVSAADVLVERLRRIDGAHVS
jgi:hypothetical protein